MHKESKQKVQNRLLIILFSFPYPLVFVAQRIPTGTQFSITMLLFLGYIFLFRTPKYCWKPWYAGEGKIIDGTPSYCIRDPHGFQIDESIPVLSGGFGKRSETVYLGRHGKTHVHRILHKMGVEDRTQAVGKALRHGLVK